MIKTLQREVVYFLILMVILAMAVHPDLLSSPMERLNMMQVQQNYVHPFTWSAAAYLLIGVVRVPVYWMIRRIKRNQEK